MFRTFYRSIRRFLRYLARPVRRGRNEGGLHIQPYRGYGTSDRVHLTGRVFRQLGRGPVAPAGSLLRDAIDLIRRLFRYGVGDIDIVASHGDAQARVTTDSDGYFSIDMVPDTIDPERRWHTLELQVEHNDLPSEPVRARFYVAPATATHVIISDIDDTVMYTGVANRLKMAWRLFMQGAKSRVAFPGVGALYRALHHGAGEEDARNPMLYVSRGPWSLYEMLETFFNLHHIPVGPILYLREWGLTLQRPLPRKAPDHKHDLIEHMLDCYTDLPFILIGDSGQHDPDIYADIVRRHRGRVAAIYIRNVDSSDATRRREIEALADELQEAGSPLVLADDSFAMAEHAADQGFISRDRLQIILREHQQQADNADGRASTARDTDADALADTLERHPDQPPSLKMNPDSGD